MKSYCCDVVGFQHMTKARLREIREAHPGGARPRPSTVRTMTEIERAWVGAFIEADGCAFVRHQPERSDHIVITITQKEIDPIATCLRVTGAGRVHLDMRVNIWFWSVSRLNDARELAIQCAPYSWKLQRVLEESDVA